ncbi:MAG: hypothetical protein KHX31_05880 [Akkermansia sp.]|uniref:hypothetical protein n=1 Tax=Akkermansia sp. TaxID=1872421 RepID=UPI0025B93207|nr:hypothetical protein [Akkermansia sp.]MBS5508149.1 hypothetical protein [Akkermansia sp.]
MDAYIAFIGVILITSFAVYLAWKNSRNSLGNEQYSSNGMARNEEKAKQAEMNNFAESEKKPWRESGISGAFRGVGIVCFVLAVIVPLVLLAGGNGQTIFAAAIFLVLALSGLGWLGVGVIIRLLEQIAENTGKR